MNKPIEPGQRFGKLLVIGSTFNQDHGLILWHCQCDCGKTVDMLKFEPITGRYLERKVISCGCMDWVSDFECPEDKRKRLKKPKPADWVDGRGRHKGGVEAIKARITSNRF